MFDLRYKCDSRVWATAWCAHAGLCNSRISRGLNPFSNSLAIPSAHIHYTQKSAYFSRRTRLMTTQGKPMTRLEVLVLIVILMLAALVMVGVLDLYSRYFGRTNPDRNSTDLRLRSSSRPSTAPGGLRRVFSSLAGFVDTSGYGPLMSFARALGPQRLVANDRRNLEAARPQGDLEDRCAPASRAEIR